MTMQPPRQKFAARLILFLCVLGCVVWLSCLDYGEKVSTDLLDLIPTNERDSELAMVRKLAGERQSRVVLFSLTIPAKIGEEPDALAFRRAHVGDLFISALRSSARFSEVCLASDTASRDALGFHLFTNRAICVC